MKHTKRELKQMQSLPLRIKIMMTKQRIKAWYESWKRYEIVNEKTNKSRFVTDIEEPTLNEDEYIIGEENGQVSVSFSGGKDSRVLLHMARKLYPDIEAVFSNTGLEYPEIQQFVKTFDNVKILRPKMRFDEVIKTYGYPIISKEVAMVIEYARKGSKWAINNLNGLDRNGKPHEFKKSMYAKYKPLLHTDFLISSKCCGVMKEKPIDEYMDSVGKKPIVAIMASESKRRENAWLSTGCNAFDGKRPMSKPMSFWTEQDVLQYIKENNLSIASVYGSIEYADNPDQIRLEEFGFDFGGREQLKTTGCDRTGCIFCGFGCHLEKESRFQRLKETHPRQYAYCIGGGEYDSDGMWKPNKEGLGFGHVFDELNKIYGDDFIKYK
jgi:3'-phosphoadenosine 5'-phosphosulfate sulfotransferase (PAPS reductase)/FAD synthetase